MPDFRDSVYQLDKKLAEKYGDQIDALVVMANMNDMDVWSNGNSTAPLFRVFFICGSDNDLKVEFILEIRFVKENHYYIDARTEEMKGLLCDSANISKDSEIRISTFSAKDFGEMLAIASKMVARRSS